MELNQEQYTNIITTLSTLVAGQATMNTHLLTLNGKVASHERELTTLRLWKAEAKGFSNAVGMGWTTFVIFASSLVSGAFVYWIKK